MMPPVPRWMATIAAVIPVVTLFVPLIVFHDPHFEQNDMTLLTANSEITRLWPILAVYWLLAVLAWLPRGNGGSGRTTIPGRWWAAIAMPATAIACWMLTGIQHAPSLIWDRVDSTGHVTTGGLVHGEPGLGFVIWVVAILLMAISAGINLRLFGDGGG